jgi:four helix bundle protein
MPGFEDLDVWVRSKSLSADLYITLTYLKDYGFRDQITRSGLSIPSNIAEGYERDSIREKKQFFNYAKGSAGELRTQIYIGIEVGYIQPDKGREWLKETEELSRMLYGLINSIKT